MKFFGQNLLCFDCRNIDNKSRFITILLAKYKAIFSKSESKKLNIG